MMSPNDILLVEKEGVDVDRANQDGAKRVEAAESVCRDLNYTLLHLTVAAFMAHMIWKGSDMGKWMEKWRKILVIVEGKMSLSRDAESR